MEDLKRTWDKNGSEDTPEERYIFGIVNTGCSINEQDDCLHQTCRFIRKTEVPVGIDDLDDQWMNVATAYWDFKKDDWKIDNTLANSLDSPGLRFVIYDGREKGQYKEDFFKSLEKARESHMQECKENDGNNMNDKHDI